MTIRLRHLDNHYSGYQELIFFMESVKELETSQVNVEIEGGFPLNLCAALGAGLDIVVQRLGSVKITFLNAQTELALMHNDFLFYYGLQHKLSSEKSALHFKKLRSADGKFFRNSVIAQLLLHLPAIQRLVSGLKRKLLRIFTRYLLTLKCTAKQNTFI